MAAGKELFKLFGLIGMQGVETTTKKLKGIDKQVRKTQKEFDRLGKRAQNVGKVLTKAFTLPLLVIGAAVVKMSADFDEALTTSLAIMGDLSDVMRKDLRDAAIEVSKVVSFSAKEAAEAYFFLASAGKSAAQSIGLLPLVAKFAQAGAFNLARATDLLTDAQSALGLSSKDTAKDMENMTRVSDVLVKANTLANATVAQFSESLTNKAGAALRILGKELEEGVAVLAVFADQGLKGAAAGESLNIVMRDLQRASLKNRRAFDIANVSVFDQSGEMRNLADIIRDLDGLLSGMSDEQRRATLTTLGFQDKSISATMALLGTADAIEEYEKQLRSAAGVTDEVAKKQLQTFWKQLGLVKDRLIAVALQGKGFAEVGNEVILPMLSKVVSAAEKLSDWWNNLNDATRKTAKGFIVLLAVIGPTVFIMGKLIFWSKALIPVLLALKTGTISYAGAVAILQKSVLGITLLIAALVALGWFWFSQWDKMSVQLKAVFMRIENFILVGLGAIGLAFADAMILIIDGLLKISAVVPGLTEKLKTAKIGLLKFQAEIFKERGAHIIATNAINEQALSMGTLSDSVKKAIADGKELIGIKEQETKETKNNIDAQIKQAKATEANAKKAVEFNKDILDQIKKLGADKFELLAIERKKAVQEAEKLGADVLAVEKLFDSKKEELRAEDTLAREELNAKNKARLEQALGEELALLEIEKQKKLLQATALGADTAAINDLFALKEQDLKKKIREDEAAKDKRALLEKFSLSTSLGNKLNNVLGKFSDNRIQRLNNEEKKRIAGIENSQLTEEEKEAAIMKVQEDTAKRRLELERAAARRQKLFSLFQIGVNTASAIVEALPNIPLSVFVGALGLAEAVAVASAPLPFFDGALIKGTAQGVNAIVGEQDQDEVIFPLETGIGLFVEGVMEKLSNIELPSLRPGPGPEVAIAGAGGGVTLQIGVLVADERGLKELERRLDTIRISENQRKGFN